MQLVQENMIFNRSTVLNNSLLWKFLVYKLVNLHINLGIYFCMFRDSKNNMKRCSFLNKQEYFLPKKKHILPSIFINCAGPNGRAV